MKVLITGGCGFVGTNLALYFKGRGDEVLCVDNLSRRGVEINARRLEQHGVVVWRQSIQNAVENAIFWRPTIILNCAAQSSATGGMQNPMQDFNDNVQTVAFALEIARETKACFVQWSTNKVYPAETINKYNHVEETTRFRVDQVVSELAVSRHHGSRSVYGATKIASECLIEEWSRAFGIPTIVNRFSCLAGKYQLGCPDQGWVAIWVIAHLLKRPLTYYGWGGKQVRDILAVDDVCRLIEKQVVYLRDSAIGGQCLYETYNVGGGLAASLSLMEATDLCRQITGNHVDVQTDGPVRWADHRVYVSGISDVAAKFDWAPAVSIEQLFHQIKEWVLKEWDVLAQHYSV